MLNIDIVSDFVCPWCFIGTERLRVAIAQVRQQRPDFEYRATWKPFFLNPVTPPEGEPYLPFLEAKFGGRAKVEEIWERVRASARPYGIEYAFEKIKLRPNTLKAHRLTAWAQAQGPAEPLVKRIYSANFQRGEDIGDLATLVSIAAECGHDAKVAAAFLATDELTEEVQRDAASNMRKGITMVPTFVIEGSQIIVGAEDPRILAAGIDKALGQA